MANKIQLRRDTTANWNNVNPILADGEPGLDITTNQVKYGDGANAWVDLSYASGGSGVTFDANGMLVLTGNLWIGTWQDNDSVLWAPDTSEYVGLWYGGERDPEAPYGPNVSITVGNESLDDNLGSGWADGLQINLDVDDKNWHFAADGILTLPFGSTINDTPSAPGMGNGQAVEIKPGGVSHNNQLLRIYPTVVNPDGNHLHLTSGDLSVTDLFLGDDDQFVQIAADGNVCIGTNNASNIWQFGTDGNLTLPGGGTILDTAPTPGITRTKYTGSAAYDVNWYSTASVIETGIVTTISEDYSGEADYSFQYAGYFKAPVTGTYTFTMFADDSGRFWIGPNALTGYTAGNANISIPMYASGTTTTSLTANEFYPIRLQINNDLGPGYLSFSWSNDQGQANTSVLTGAVFANLGHTAITADNDIELKTNNGTTRTWRFGTDGDLTLPSGLVFDRAHTSIRVGQGFHIASGEGVNIKAIDETDPNNLIYKDWYFGTDGGLTLPGDIQAQEGNDINVVVYNPTVEGTPGGVTFSVQNRDVMTDSKTTQFDVGPADIVLTTDFAGARNEWTFGTDGSLTFPTGGTQYVAYTGGSTGYTGSLGYFGSVGYTGSGVAGYTGSSITGYTGSASTVIGYSGSKGADGNFGGAAFNYYYSKSAIDTIPGPGPGAGYIAFGNVSFSSTSIMRISYIDKSAVSVESFLQTVDDSTSAIKGHFSVTDKNNSDVYAIFAITGLHSEHTDHFDIPVAHITGETSFDDLTEVIVTFARTGDVGDQGPPGYTGSASEVAGYTGSASEVAGYTGSASDVIGYTGSEGVGYTGSASEIAGYTGSASEVIGYTGSASEVAGYTGSEGVGYTGSASEVVGYTGSASEVIGYTGSEGKQPFNIMGDWISGYTYDNGNVVFDSSVNGGDNQYYIVHGGSYSNITNPSQQYLEPGNSWDRFYITSITGYTGSASEVIGYTGSQGLGYTGSASEVIGYTGSASEGIGYTGSASTEIGYWGSVGYTGSQGEIGYTGSVGYTGSQGEIGYTGSVGYTGSASEVIGYTGSVGYTGSTIPIYGSFWDNDTVQANLSTGANISISNVYANSGVYILNDGQIKFTTDGVYKIEYSLQFQNSDNKQNSVFVWLRKNGVTIPNTSSYFTIHSGGSANGYICATGPFLDSTVISDDFYQISWSADDTHVYLQGIAANELAPASPSSIVTVTKI